MPKKKVLSPEQLEKFKKMALDETVSKKEIRDMFDISDTKIETLSRELRIKGVWKRRFECSECHRIFWHEKPSELCPECKATPLVCVVCGKEFPKKYWPYNQKTCSPKCRGVYRSESGIAKASSQKVVKTKLERYGTIDPTVIAEMRNGGKLNKRICPLCGKEFQPTAVRQVYCTDDHYGPCPWCGKPTIIKDYSVGPTACSEECRMAQINATCLEKYGNKDAVNSEHAKALAREHSLERYGYEYYSQSPEAKEHYKNIVKERYGVNAPIEVPEFREKARQTNLRKYGTEWAHQSEDIKAKTRQTNLDLYGGQGLESPILRERILKTNLEKYGYEFRFSDPEFRKQIEDSNLEKYGTKWPATLPEANEKREKTNLERYGATNPLGSKEIQDKIREKWIEKYGGPNPMYDLEMAQLASDRQQQAMINKYGVNASVHVPEIVEKINNTCMERYGAPWYFLSDECVGQRISSYNRKFSEWLDKINVPNSFEYIVGNRPFDIHIDNTNILIEIDPTVSHNSHESPWGPKSVTPPNYHLEKTKLAEENGYRCIHIFDWDNQLAILSLFKKKQRIYARQCSIMQIDKRTADIFTIKNHLQGKCKGQNLVYGLYYKGELVQMMSFGKPRYAKKEGFDFELLRLCSRLDVEVVGGASKLFARFKKDHPNASVISYCDYAKFTGTVYEKLGMTLKRMSPPAKVWSKGSEYITDNYLRAQGFDRIFNENHGKGTSNEQLMLDNKWFPVYDCGQKVFVYEPNK